MCDGSDARTVHGRTSDFGEIVRYGCSGEWWLEFPHARLMPARRLSVAEAVRLAAGEGGQAFLSLPGGGRFDYLVLRARKTPPGVAGLPRKDKA